MKDEDTLPAALEGFSLASRWVPIEIDNGELPPATKRSKPKRNILPALVNTEHVALIYPSVTNEGGTTMRMSDGKTFELVGDSDKIAAAIVGEDA